MKSRIFMLVLALLLVALPIHAQDVEIDDIIIARDVTLGDVSPIQADDVFPSSLTAIYAVISGTGLEMGDAIEIVWIYDGDELDSLVFENDSEDEEFVIWSNWSNPDGMQEGDWTVEIYYDDERIASEDFEVTDDPYVFPVRFAQDCGRATGVLVNEGVEFEEIYYVYAYVEYANFDEDSFNALWFWSLDGDTFELDQSAERSGENWHCFILHNAGELMPEGEYGISILDEDGDELRESGEIEIQE